MDDLTLLQKFEPVVRFTKGELFFPCAVDGYLEQCNLIMRDNRGNARVLAGTGELSAEKLTGFKEVPPGHIIFLRFVDEPMTVIEYQNWLLRSGKPVFKSQGRMARVGLFSRVIDSLGLTQLKGAKDNYVRTVGQNDDDHLKSRLLLPIISPSISNVKFNCVTTNSFFDASLLIRGVVPGGTTAAAEVRYREILNKDPRYTYYGRVIRDGGYTVLHYIFFYVMNDFRSTFHGTNDHESDWEQIFIYLSDEENPVPIWVAYASHDFSGDNLRRRWDDPELKKEGMHPVIFAGAGSHSSYFLPGEYLLSIEPKYLHAINDVASSIRIFWASTLGQGTTSKVIEKEARLIMPYIDYARGDGVSIGPGLEKSWSPILLTEDAGWAEEYRGLWGMDTRDRFDGERGPAGPKFNRDGTVRVSWYDPLGWAGLDKVTPQKFLSTELAEHITALFAEYEAVEEEIANTRKKLRLLELEVQSLHRTSYLSKIHRAYQNSLETAQNDLHTLYAQRTDLTELLAASQSHLQALNGGDLGDPQAHITVKRYPEPSLGPVGRYVALWAAISGSLMLFVLAALLLFLPSGLILWGAVMAAIFLAIESIIWGRFTRFLLNATILLAIASSLIMIWDFLWQIVIFGLFAIVVISIMKNLRELAGR